MDDKPTVDSKGFMQDRQPDIIRKSFRVPVENGDIYLVIKGRRYQVVDISPEGIGILCDKKISFAVAETVDDCELVLPGETIRHLSAKSVHFTGSKSEQWKNGIHWISMDETDQKKIVDLVSRLKRELLNPKSSG